MRQERELPTAWREAFRREREGRAVTLADPLPERRMARLLAAFIAAGLFFLVFPGTLIGAWNLINIGTRQNSHAVSAAWIQAHGHAQLFGWVGTFIIGISLYTAPKFRGAALRSPALGWVMFAAWTVAVAARWLTGIRACHWEVAWPIAAALELAVAVLLLWQCSAAGPSHKRTEPYEYAIFLGFGGLILTMAYQLVVILAGLPEPMIPTSPATVLISLALWGFCLPIVFGYSGRFLPAFLGLAPSGRRSAIVANAFIAAGTVLYLIDWQLAAAALLLTGVLAGCWWLRIFHPSRRPAKVAGVDPLYPWFARAAFAWLVVAAVLSLGARIPGVLGASRHAFTVGLLATLIFSIGPRILPSFLNSRELWSPRLMRASMILLTAGCALRVTSEPLAYAGWIPFAWKVLPVSAFIETSAVVLFAINMAATQLSRVPAWFAPEQVKDSMTLYWYIHSYPAARKLLIGEGLTTLATAREIPKSLTLCEAAECDGVDPAHLVRALRVFFDQRLARTARAQLERRPQQGSSPRTA